MVEDGSAARPGKALKQASNLLSKLPILTIPTFTQPICELQKRIAIFGSLDFWQQALQGSAPLPEINAASQEVNATSSRGSIHKRGRGGKRGRWQESRKDCGARSEGLGPRSGPSTNGKNTSRNKGKAQMSHVPRNVESTCHRCGAKGHWSHLTFIVDGCQKWKRIGGNQCAFQHHVGKLNSPHHLAMQKWISLKTPHLHIEKVVEKQSKQQMMENRLRLTTTIEGIRYLANQALAFRGHDESIDSSNRGNFIEIIKSFARMNIEVEKVVLDKAPQNAQYIVHDIQKQILHIFANKVRKAICKELGKNKFCILVDESLDESGKEQMTIILRFVDCDEFIRERFFDIVSVVDTNALTLKKVICKVLGNNDILVENMRGQGYDGASNMRGSWNGLQALFLQDCPYAYYVHCFAHRLQLALNGVAKDVKVLWRFFLMLTNIVNFISTSAKRRSELNLIRKVELNGLLDSGELETGRGLNQARSLKRVGATRWGSHYASITSLMCLFKETKLLIQEISDHGPNQQFRGNVESNYIAMMSFEFVFSLVLMDKIWD
ncbi:zinc finger MYM-type protein 1-like [Prunus persica]|uniref:zinc finger MYM-type protein 1-like n=1 Tax=Prunus persica TaxID=3760 RepID=UPI0009AB8575|nr:zinc finger MYM-type protein 1-like [Prunus persica]